MILYVTFFAFIATLGFGIIFNIKGKKLFFAALGGAISWFFYSLSLELKFSSISSLFISSLIFSTYCEILARILKTPVTTLVICALIPLVPGGGMYYTMLEIITGDINKALELGINALASAGTLALGVIFVSTITKLIVSHKRNLEYKKFNQN
jgi:uncharacterized membrane protein YjjB (DUF3815 family)